MAPDLDISPLGRVAAVVAGLAFVFFLLALIGSGLLEAMAGLFAWRATTLRRATDVLLGAAPTLGTGTVKGWAAAHLTRGAGPEAHVANQDLAPFVTRVRRDPLVVGALGAPASYVHPRAFATAVLLALGGGSLPGTLAEIRASAAALPGPAGRALAAIAAGAESPAGFRSGVAAWYENAMREASAAYKCNAQRVLLAIATVLTIGFDVDALHLASTIAGGPLPLGWPVLARLGPVPGWFVTIVAVSMGAPFWFDLLQSVANLRGVEAPPTAERKA